MSSRFLGCAVLLVSLVAASPLGAQETDPWAALWANRVENAEKSFRAGVEADGRDLESRRGLVLAEVTRGRERAALADLLELCDEDAAGPRDFLLARWYYRQVLTNRKDEEAFQDTYEHLSGSEAFGPLDRRPVLLALSDATFGNGEVGATRKVAGELNRIDTWEILGPFNNVSGSGQRKDFLRAGEEPLDREYTGKAGQPLRWTKVGVLDLLDQINFENQLNRSLNVCAYAGAGLSVREPGDYLLSFTHRGSFTAMVDGDTLIDLEEPVDQGEYLHFRVHLDRGNHSLLLKAGGADEPPAVAASISTLSGEATDKVVATSLLSYGLQSGHVPFARLELPMVSALRSAAMSDTSDAEAALWWMLAIEEFGLEGEARTFAPLVLRRFPQCALLETLASDLLTLAGRTDAARDAMEEAARLDPDNSRAVLVTARKALERKRYAEADSILDRAVARAPDFVDARTLRDSASEEGAGMEAFLARAEDFRAKFPDFAVPYFALAYYNRLLDPGASHRYLKEAIDRTPRGYAAVSKLVQAVQKDDPEEQVKRLKDLAELFPDLSGIGTQLGAAMLRAKKNDAIRMCKGNAFRFPQSFEAQNLWAMVAERLGSYDPEMKTEAIDRYRRALSLRPGSFETRDKLRQLLGEKPVRELLPPLDLEGTRETALAAAGSVKTAEVFLDDSRRILFDDGSTYGERALVVRIDDAQGVDRFGTLSTGVNPVFNDLDVLEARTYKPDGPSADGRVLAGKVAFEELAPGDVIVLHYRWSSWWVGSLNRDFWDSHVFQWDVPCRLSRYELMAPTADGIDWRLHNLKTTEGVSGTRNLEGFVLRAWTLHDVPARPEEDWAPPVHDASPWLDVSTVGSWGRIVDWYRDLSDGPSAPDDEIDEEARRLTAGAAAPKDAIPAVFDFVANRIAYEDLDFQYSAFVPARASDVLHARFGDCKDQACLLRAFLTDAGVESYFALIQPADEGATEYLPSPRFTHAVVAVPDETGGYRFLDPTASGTTVSGSSPGLGGAKALVIRPGIDSLITIPYAPLSQPDLEVISHVSLAEDGSLELTRTEEMRDATTLAGYRRELAGADEKERRNALLRTLGRNQMGLDVLSSTWSGLSGTGDSLELAYELRIRNAVRSSGSLRLVTLPWRTRLGESMSRIIAAPDRSLPLYLGSLRLFEDERMDLTIPSGWSLEEVPPALEDSSAAGSFRLEFSRQGDRLTAHRSVRLAVARVPVEGYAEFRSFLEGLYQAQSTVLVFKGGP